MKKLFFLKYGSDKTKEEISELLDSKWDMTFSEHDSFYFGVYLSYSGLYADKIAITDNYISHTNEWLDEEKKGFKSLIEASFINGKNAEKLSKYKFLKGVLNQLDMLSIINDICLEEE